MKHLLSSSAYLVVNKNLCKVLGIKATILLADLISKEELVSILEKYGTEPKMIKKLKLEK